MDENWIITNFRNRKTLIGTRFVNPNNEDETKGLKDNIKRAIANGKGTDEQNLF